MKKTQEFSTRSIKEKVKNLPDTFYGDECNISFHAERIFRISFNSGEPVRFDNFGISFCQKGEIRSEVNLIEQTAQQGDLELFSPGTSYRYLSMSDDCSLIGVALSPYMVKESGKDMPLPSPILGENHKTRLSAQESSVFYNLCKTYLDTLFCFGESAPLSRMTSLCIQQFVVQEFSKKDLSVRNVSNRRDHEICRQLIILLNQTKGTKRTLEYFADRLCISKHYLSIAVKNASGQSVKNLIDKSAITEIKILLHSTDMTVSQIADRLEFPGSSFLCKYFKAKTGQTPLQYRSAYFKN